jgi:hypothetical protein
MTGVTDGMRCMRPTTPVNATSSQSADSRRSKAWPSEGQWRALSQIGSADEMAEMDVHGLLVAPPVFVDLGGASQELRAMSSAGGGGGGGGSEYLSGSGRKLLAKAKKSDGEATSEETHAQGRIAIGIAAVMLWVQLFQVCVYFSVSCVCVCMHVRTRTHAHIHTRTHAHKHTHTDVNPVCTHGGVYIHGWHHAQRPRALSLHHYGAHCCLWFCAIHSRRRAF